MKKVEEMKREMLNAYIEVQHLSEKARSLGNAGVVVYLKCAVANIDAALETMKAEEEENGK